jgi:hypothetical protein
MKYWAYMNNEILGPFEKEKLLELAEFGAAALICPQTAPGEKTEDWKEASSYPEVALLLNLPAPSAATPSIELPPQTAAGESLPGELKHVSPVELEPLAPQPSAVESSAIEVNHLKPADNAGKIEHPVNDLVKSVQNSTDPMTLSEINRKVESISIVHEERHDPEQSLAQQQIIEKAPEYVILQDPKKAPYAAGLETGAGQERFPSNPGAAAPRAGTSPLTLGELNLQLDPLRQKMDQLQLAISSMGDARSLRDLPAKLTAIEISLSEIKTALSRAEFSRGAAGPSRQTAAPEIAKLESGYAHEPASEPQKKKIDEPKKEASAPEIIDTGRKSSKVTGIISKLFKFLLSLVLFAAVAAGTLIGLKAAGVFDVSKYLPFPLPFISTAEAPTPVPEDAQAG